ncbi:MAG: PQQ-binding-like beta-propeller repeat protein [Porphyromonadaceae bacterium]|nr:PQQ-binding-like beta-propeller repeat protein [Porphyromonadaceae bacterium]
MNNTKKNNQSHFNVLLGGFRGLLLLSFQLILFSLSAITPFHFALLTDLHITQSTTAVEDLENSVRQINSTPNIEFVLVTGDVTEFGDKKSLEKAKELLDKLSVPYYITSGNHETKWNASGHTDFAEIFGSDRFDFEHKGIRFFGFNTGPVLRMADGHVSPQDISWLKNELCALDKSKPVILATHYPLQYGDVDNWYELTDVVRTHNIRAVLGGHYHRNAIFSYDGIPGLINRSNLRGKEDAGGYSVYSITSDGLIVYEQTIGGVPKRWAGFSMTAKYFDEKGSDTKYPDFSVNKAFPQVEKTWIVKTEAGIYTSPVTLKNRVFVGDDLGNLTSYNLKNGKKQWSFQAGNRIAGTPAVADGVVVFGSADKNIYGVNANNGKLIWKIPTNEAVLGAVTIENGIAYIGGSDNTFRAIWIKNGTLLWEYDKLKGYVETKPLIAGNNIIFGAWDTNLYALNKDFGHLVWKWTNGIKTIHNSPAAVWAVSANGKVFVVNPEPAMTAIDLETGKTIWRTKQSMVRESIGISEDGSRIYAKTMRDSVVCYSTVENTPVKIWSSNVGYGYEHNPSMLMEKDGTVFGSTKNGVIFALDAHTGKVIWKHKIGNSLVNTVVPIDKRNILVTTASGEVCKLSEL